VANWIENVVRPKIRNLWAKRESAENLWVKCPETGEMVFHKDLEANQFVFPNSGYHQRLDARTRLRLFFDDGTWDPIALPPVPTDPPEVPEETTPTTVPTTIKATTTTAPTTTRASTTTTRPPTTTAVVPAALKVSTSANRSSPNNLGSGNLKVGKPYYIFATSTKQISRVEFYNNASGTGTKASEDAATPFFDYVGSAGSNALPKTYLTAGPKVITAKVFYTDGTQTSKTANFTVVP